MPSSPIIPNTVITLRVLELYRVVHLRCPRLGIQAFVRALCDIHGVAPRPWLAAQFSVSYDVYLAIRAIADKRVQAALGRDTPNWRLKNACPCCLYKLEGEPAFEIPFMATCDGNNSLSRFHRREREVDEEGVYAPGASRERDDNRVVPGDYYISREDVDKWAKDGVTDLIKSFDLEGVEEEGDVENEEVEGRDVCAERWQNMKEEVTSRAYGMYDETGFFPALCRHGFVLKVVDMVKSGELSKYPLAILFHLLNVLGELAMGYDVGCKLGKTVKAHPAIKDLAASNNFRALIGAFHGHGHARLCGLDNLLTYRWRAASPSSPNPIALASTTRYASRFHRQQAITTYLKHADAFDTYQGLSQPVLCNKYPLYETMRELGVESRDVFEAWRSAEKAHLRTLSKEPEEETLEMEYLQKLINLKEADERAAAVLGVQTSFVAADAEGGYSEQAKSTRRVEAQRRHACEIQERAAVVVRDLEVRLAIATRWEEGDEKWEAVAKKLSRRHYQRALDKLQGLIIARMFELAKCNMSGTGYKLRKHIAKALQVRSKAVKNAITAYNKAAERMTPPKPTLSWEEVVEYGFLADFDLLREGRQDIRGEPWAQPAGRAAMDQHFKLLRAKEEIERLNVEIRRFVSFMRDEHAFLQRQEERLRVEGREGLAIQVASLCSERDRFTRLHMQRLVKLSKEPGFTGNIRPGTSISRERHLDNDTEMPTNSPDPTSGGNDADEGDDDDGDSDDEDGVVAEAFFQLMRIAGDDTERQQDM
ncbi:hypothetical protein C8F01DRAFT_1208564 [Mycena amicta]|nr:hypothetical protein C8F01DRAFT_1208564 [Mycena amicta]